MNEHYESLLRAMTGRYEQLTGCCPDDASDIGIRMKVLAEELSLLYEELLKLKTELFPQTSSGVYLERHAQTRGLTRKGAVAAKGVLRFTRSHPAEVDIPIPKGTVCSTVGEPACRFVTLEDGLLPAGETAAEVPAQGAEGGGQNNAAAGRITLMVTPVSQISAVTNPAPFTGGAEAESDEALRARLLESYRTVSNGTNAAFYHQQAMQHEGITSAKVLPRSRGVGTVDVIVTCGGTVPGEALLEQLRQELQEKKEINVDVAVRGAEPKAVDLRVQVLPGDPADFEALAEQTRRALSRHMEAQPVGAPLTLAGLYRCVMELPGAANCRILSPQADVFIREDQVVTAASVTAERMEGVI